MNEAVNAHSSNLRDEIQSVDPLGEVIVNLHVLDRDAALESAEHLDSFPQRIKLSTEGKPVYICLLLPKTFRPNERLLLTLQTASNRIKCGRWRGSRRPDPQLPPNRKTDPHPHRPTRTYRTSNGDRAVPERSASMTLPIPNCEVVDLGTPELGNDYALQDPDSGVIVLMASHVDLEK